MIYLTKPMVFFPISSFFLSWTRLIFVSIHAYNYVMFFFRKKKEKRHCLATKWSTSQAIQNCKVCKVKAVNISFLSDWLQPKYKYYAYQEMAFRDGFSDTFHSFCGFKGQDICSIMFPDGLQMMVSHIAVSET